MQQITKYIKEETSDRWFLSRFAHAVKTIAKEEGCFAGGLVVASSIAIKVYALAIAYFALEGSARALIDLSSYNSTDVVGLRPLGDSGGWTSLAIFSLFGAGTILLKFIREGEYLRIKKTFNTWVKNNQAIIQEDPDSFKKLYQTINAILDAYQSQCLFEKSLVSRRLMALKTMDKHPFLKKSPLQKKDEALKKVYENLKKDLEDTTSMKYYFHRLYDGQRAVAKNSSGARMSSLVLGVALPLILLITAIFSCIGEFGLGKELFVDKEELTDIGHFGEWPLNAVEAIATAFFLHLWFMVNEGDFVRTKRVYKIHLQGLKEKPIQYNRVVDVANEELKGLSNSCGNFKLPGEYQIQKI